MKEIDENPIFVNFDYKLQTRDCLRIKIVMGVERTHLREGSPVKQRRESSGQAPQESNSLEMAQRYASQLKPRRKTKTMQTLEND